MMAKLVSADCRRCGGGPVLEASGSLFLCPPCRKVRANRDVTKVCHRCGKRELAWKIMGAWYCLGCSMGLGNRAILHTQRMIDYLSNHRGEVL